MGTRSLTIIKDEDGKELVCMYRQFDGYPTGHGQELATFLAGGELVNGLGLHDDKLVFNGMGCLAAAVVSYLKTGPGGIYLYPPGSRDCGEEYIYTVFPRNKILWISVARGCMTAFGLPGTKQENMNILFEGPVSDYNAESIEKAEQTQEPPPNDYLDSKTT